MANQILRGIAGLALAFAVHCQPATATEVIPLSIAALTARAELIVQAKPISSTTLLDAEGRIYTKVELQVLETWKGAPPGGSMSVVLGGGLLGDRRTVVSGQVQYRIGEECVAFLIRNTRGEYLTVGLQQGKFKIELDASTGVKLAANPFVQSITNSTGIAKSAATGGGGESVPLTLELLKKEVLSNSSLK